MLDYIPKYSSHSVIVIKMCKEQIIRNEELKVMESVLVDHQKAVSTFLFHQLIIKQIISPPFILSWSLMS
jgi:hypothetical protein